MSPNAGPDPASTAAPSVSSADHEPPTGAGTLAVGSNVGPTDRVTRRAGAPRSNTSAQVRTAASNIAVGDHHACRSAACSATAARMGPASRVLRIDWGSTNATRPPSGRASETASARNSAAASAYGPPPNRERPPRVVAAAIWFRNGGLPMTRSNVRAGPVGAQRIAVHQLGTGQRCDAASMAFASMSTPVERRSIAQHSPHPGEERAVTACRVEHRDRAARVDAVERDRHHVVDQIGGRVPRHPAACAAPPRRSFVGCAHGQRRVGPVTDAAGRYLTFDRAEWADLRAATPLTLRESHLAELRGINDRIDLDEVAAVYLPLTRLLNLYVAATQNLHKVSAAFLGTLLAEGAVRDRRGRQRRRRQEHLRPHPAGAAVALARPPAGRSGHHRRLPAPQRRARGARHHEPQGLPRELRHPPADRVPARAEERRDRRRRRPCTATSCTTSCPATRWSCVSPTS